MKKMFFATLLRVMLIATMFPVAVSAACHHPVSYSTVTEVGPSVYAHSAPYGTWCDYGVFRCSIKIICNTCKAQVGSDSHTKREDHGTSNFCPLTHVRICDTTH